MSARGGIVKKRTGSEARPKSLQAKGLSTKRAASVKGGGTGGGGGTGKVKFNEFSIQKTTDKTSPV
jgi:hypothetical protein